MNIAPILVSYLPLATCPFVYLGGAILAIAILILIWNWICAMCDRNIERERLKRAFLTLSVDGRTEFIRDYRQYPEKRPKRGYVNLIVSVAEFAAKTKADKGEIIAMLYGWHCTGVTDTKSIASA